jgi:uncharacterized protein YndB with AHSA1/START domain
MGTGSNPVSDFKGREFVIVREFAAPRELVWRACTEAHHVAQWWGPRGFTAPVCEWDARPGKKIHVLMRGPDGTEHRMGGEFREVVAPERLVTMTGALDEPGKYLFQFLHTLTLAERNGKTELTMHSRVIQTTAEANKYISGFEMGMTLSLERLGGYLAQKTEPYVIERVFDAPVAQVWEAITTEDDLKQWYFDLKEFKPEVDVEFEFTVDQNGVNYRHLCRVAELISQKRLAYTWRYEGYAGNSLVSFDLSAEGNKTRLRLTHLSLESFTQFTREDFAKGWTQLIGTNLKQFVETRRKAKN